MIGVGAADGLRADVEQAPFDLRVEARQSTEEPVARLELLDGYRRVLRLLVAQVVIFAIGL
jgi:hypothetical protein